MHKCDKIENNENKQRKRNWNIYKIRRKRKLMYFVLRSVMDKSNLLEKKVTVRLKNPQNEFFYVKETLGMQWSFEWIENKDIQYKMCIRDSL